YAHALVLGQPTVDLGRLPSARFLALSRVVDLRCVDADVADLLDTVRQTNMDSVAVDDADNQALERRGLSAGRTGDRGDEQEEREEPGAAPKSTHGPTLSWRRGHCPLLSTLRTMAGWRALRELSVSFAGADVRVFFSGLVVAATPAEQPARPSKAFEDCPAWARRRRPPRRPRLCRPRPRCHRSARRRSRRR